ncbi:MAG TPA: DUF3592 domain-containing protein [Terriglobales bacterium]|nr:DUF3592 domain-containing protein [Terriglobales bacterium]
MDSFGYIPYAVAGIAVVAFVAAYFGYRRRKTPEQLERERRYRLNAVGRITDGTVIDACELAANGKGGPVQVLIYQYDVAGVQYEASQDVTYIRQLVDIHTCKVGLQASVKYDPQNPGDSIVVSESWSGLHSGTKWNRKSGITSAP